MNRSLSHSKSPGGVIGWFREEVGDLEIGRESLRGIKTWVAFITRSSALAFLFNKVRHYHVIGG